MNKVLKNSWALFLGMGFIMMAYGFQGSLLGVRAVQEEFSLTATGFMMSGYFIGYFIGAATIPNIISRVGHIRVFAAFALFFIESFALVEKDLIIVPLMCILCVAIPLVLVTIAPRFIPAAEVNLFFLLETIIGPIWVWLIIKEQPSIETLQGGVVIIVTIAIHSFLKLKKT